MNTDESYPVGKTGLILVDPLNDFLSEGGKGWHAVKEVVTSVSVVANLQNCLAGAHARGVQCFYAPMCTYPHDYQGWKFLSPIQRDTYAVQMFQVGSWGAEFHPALQPEAQDIVVAPHKTSCAFVSTELDLQLRQHGIERIVLAGMLANTCVELTGRYGVELGYHVTFLTDAVGATSWDAYRAAVDVNYPRYANALLTVDEFLQALPVPSET
jgi:nicotinamidase-related amidase